MLRPLKTGGKDTGFLFKRKDFLEMLESLIIAEMERNMDGFSEQLLTWYGASFRPLPWRETKDPYAIWLSEVILQQTRIEQGTPYYYKFLENFPTITDLANAPEDQVLHCWQGLGYYSRARNLHAAAKKVRDEFKGVFPSDYESILSLPGVGPYTAAAIASIAFNLPYAVVDGNVYRFLSRLFGINTPIDSPAGKKEFQFLAQSLINPKHPGNFNQAMMEFGARVCRPASPDCEYCIFRSNCFAYKNASIDSLPVKAAKTKVRNRYFNFLILCDDQENVLIEKRGGNDIWQGLYQFPLIETESSSPAEGILNVLPIINDSSFQIQKVSSELKHILSHQHLFARFIHIQVANLPHHLFPNAESIPLESLKDRAFPRLITRYLKI